LKSTTYAHFGTSKAHMHLGFYVGLRINVETPRIISNGLVKRTSKESCLEVWKR